MPQGAAVFPSADERRAKAVRTGVQRTPDHRRRRPYPLKFFFKF